MKKLLLVISSAMFMTSCMKDSAEQPLPQISQDEFAAAKKGENGGRPLSALLSGANEVPGPGDPDGSGMIELTLNHGQGTINYVLTVSNIEEATGAHIHLGKADVAGPVKVVLAAPSSGSSSGTISGVDRDLIKDIMQNPENYYVNVHNATYPPGAVRGQLSK